ncbi:MAG: GH32 C-terminal domain-containing protein [Clostridiaceae bacterium]|jgi:sucrose-6-phosphate hydrolase SacC (GH32 family)|nr:GH32 C-terminal domain-containing protein [Clostridiaceae bacterium]
MADGLTRADIYSEFNSHKIDDEKQRFDFHVTGRTGWINDPNGFSWYDGKIHLFYQHNPYSNSWGPMHWGHVTGTDFVKWNYEKIALTPDNPAYDAQLGAFSGSAIFFKGRYYLVYTGCNVGRQTQCIAVSDDGVSFTKYAGNPVLSKKDLPKGASVANFRDPKVWEKDGTVYMIVSAKNRRNGRSRLLLYATENMTDWQYRGVVFSNSDSKYANQFAIKFGIKSANKFGSKFINRFAGKLDRKSDSNSAGKSDSTSSSEFINGYAGKSNNLSGLGRMLECPDIFELDGTDVLIVSPQNIPGHRNKHASVYITGKLNYVGGALSPIGKNADMRLFSPATTDAGGALSPVGKNADILLFSPENTDAGSALSNANGNAVCEIDYGLDFYAPQTMLMPDGRRIMVAWMATWNRAPINALLKHGYAGALTFPRELTLFGGRLYQNPVKEIENYYTGAYRAQADISAGETRYIDEMSGKTQDIAVEFPRGVGKTGISVFDDEAGNGLRVYYENGKVYLDRSDVIRNFYKSDTEKISSCGVPSDTQNIKIRLLTDKYSCEVFVNDGYSAMTATVAPYENQRKTAVFSDNPAAVSIVRHAITVNA